MDCTGISKAVLVNWNHKNYERLGKPKLYAFSNILQCNTNLRCSLSAIQTKTATQRIAGLVILYLRLFTLQTLPLLLLQEPACQLVQLPHAHGLLYLLHRHHDRQAR